MKKKIEISGRKIGENEPVFIIAEAGINHNGNILLAKEMIKEAARAGAHAIKFQTHIADKEMVESSITADYIGEPIFGLIKRMELSKEEHKDLIDFSRENNIIFLSTPFCMEAADLLDELGVPAFKTGSGELTNLPLLEHIAKKGKPMIVSTGMCNMDEIEESINSIKKYNTNYILLQCTSTYPTKYEDVNLGVIRILNEKFNVPVGLSDHSSGIYTALGGVALGACMIEKHFTLSRDLPGPDQKASIEPNELAELVKGADAIFKALGANKTVINEELPVQQFARESVVSLEDIPNETTITKAMVTVKRPGTGIPARDLIKVIGKKTKKAIKKNSILDWGCFY